MDEAMLSAVSGVDGNQSWLNVIGNNIANANTTGFKEDIADFGSLLTQQITGAAAPTAIQGGTNPEYQGTGVNIQSITPNENPGSLQQTNDPTDVFINGGGYVISSVQGTNLYTRDGTILFDANGNMVTPNGGKVQGWQAGNGGVQGQINNSLPITGIQIPVGLSIQPKATGNVNLGGNLPADVTGGTVETASSSIFDAQGNALNLVMTYTEGLSMTNAVNDSVIIRLNGGAATTINLAPAARSVAWTNTASLVAQINAQLVVGFGAGQITASLNASGNLVLTGVGINTIQVTGGTALSALQLATMGAAASSTTATGPLLQGTNEWFYSGTLSNDAGFGFGTTDFNDTVVATALVNPPAMLQFSGTGTLTAVAVGNGTNLTLGTNGVFALRVTPTTPDSAGATLNPFNVNWPASQAGANNVTQYAGADSLQVLSQDGYATGTLAALSINTAGVIIGAFTNGQSLNLGQLALATFANPKGLQLGSNNMWAQTANSGMALTNVPGTGGAGTLTGGALEASNVDMARELTSMVIAQTSYQSNTRVITTETNDLTSLIQSV